MTIFDYVVFCVKACDLKCLLGELDADSLTTETIYSVLDDYKQLMDVAVETISANRFHYLRQSFLNPTSSNSAKNTACQ